jgi:galactokinase
MMDTFIEVFGIPTQVKESAHGRVNLIGEHTDYNGGFVLPTCIPQASTVSLHRRPDNLVRLADNNLRIPEADPIYIYELGEESLSRHWSDYIQGVTWLLRKEGYDIGGFDCLIDSKVPMGSGLSSSAALEVSLLKGLNKLFDLKMDGVTIAKLGQRVENDFVGARIGIMDQMVASLGRMGEALFIDTKDLTFQHLPLPLSEMELLVISSGVTHSNSQGSYNLRRSECEQACEALGVAQLRDLDVSDLPKLEVLSEVLRRRARHVITENDRVLQAVKALKEKQFKKLGDLFNSSHQSMRDDYQVSIPEIDLLVSLANDQKEVLGARLTGGGFGGSIVALCKPGTSAQVGKIISEQYDKKTGLRAYVLVPPSP